MTNQITPEISTWNGKFFEDCYLLRIKQAKDIFRFYATVVKLEPLDIHDAAGVDSHGVGRADVGAYHKNWQQRSSIRSLLALPRDRTS